MGNKFPPLPINLKQLRLTEDFAPPCPILAEYPIAFSSICNDWQITRSLADQKSDQCKAILLSKLLGTEKIPFTHIPKMRNGYIGVETDGKIGVNYYTHYAPISTFVRAVIRCLDEPDLGAVYAQSRPLTHFPLVASQLNLGALVGDIEHATTRIWIGTGEHINGLHFDCFTNFICMVAGSKRISLFPPHCLASLKATPPRKGIGGATSSPIDLLHPNSKQLTELQLIAHLGMTVILKPGDTLLVPPNWWHYVESKGFNVMVNTWFHSIDRSKIRQIEYDLKYAIRTASTYAPHELIMLRSLLLTLDGSSLGSLAEGSHSNSAHEIIKKFKRTQKLPRQWSDFIREATEYYLLSCLEDAECRKDIINYATGSTKAERYINTDI